MLVGHLDQPTTFETLLHHNVWQKALTWIQEHRQDIPKNGEYEIDGQDLRALVQTVQVKAEAERAFESHRREIDLQCCFTGYETIAWAPTDSLTVNTEYDSKNDYVLYDVPSSTTVITMTPGTFAIFFPEDGHLPALNGAGSRKVVIKINQDLLTGQFTTLGPFELTISTVTGAENFSSWKRRGRFDRTNKNISLHNFPLSAAETPIAIGSNKAVHLANFGRTVANEDVPRLLAEQGYRPSSHAWLLELNAVHPTLMDDHVMIHHDSVMTKPWLGPERVSEVICLHNDKGIRRLRTHYADTNWGPHIWFVVEKIN